MLITRKLINPNIKFHDYGSNLKYGTYIKHYNYNDLIQLIDAYKNIFILKGAKPDMNVVIGEKPCIHQIAMTFACAELGLRVTIVGNPYPAGQHHYVKGSINPNLKLLYPIDFYILNENIAHLDNKHKLFNDIANNTIIASKEIFDYTPNNLISANESTIFLRCLTSGTTGAPKVIEHTHEFLSALITRNSNFYYGNMGAVANLNHGSSPATYFLPGLVSKNVKHYFNFFCKDNYLNDILNEYREILDHLMLPYTNLIDDIFSSDLVLKKCYIYTLFIIRKEWIEKVKEQKVKDVISIFGSNETSGPIMINQATDIDFSEDTYKQVDDFYQISVNDNNELEVKMPIYDKIVCTNDTVKILENKIKYIGRSNLYRINDLEIDIGIYQKEIKKYINADLIVDTKQNRIYLAIWDLRENLDIIKKIDSLLKDNSNGLHFITSYECLNYQDFLSGIKLDNEALREHFRNKF